MAQSTFAQIYEKIFPVFGKFIELINGNKNKPVYLHKTMLRTEFSPDRRWRTSGVDTRYVKADVVALDSPLPLKTRPALRTQDGFIPKIGVQYNMNETDFDNVKNLLRFNANDPQAEKKILQNAVLADAAIDEANEAHFLEALSNGFMLQDEANSEGLGARVDYGYKEDNIFGVQVLNAIDKESIDNVFAAADAKGISFSKIAISKRLYDAMRKENWAKILCAGYQRVSVASVSYLQTPSASLFNEAFKDEYGVDFIIIDRSVLREKNGIATAYKPFNQNRMIFLPSEQVGALVWSKLAEAEYKSEGVIYTESEYKLISVYRQTDPTFCEKTKGQAQVLPVIENIDSIFVLDQTINESDPQTEGDANFTFDGKTYLKAEVIANCNSNGVDVPSGATDAQLLSILNAQSKSVVKKVFAGLTYIALSASELTFTASADTTGKNITVTTNGTLSASDSADWTTVTADSTNKVVNVKVTANSGESASARESVVTVTAKTGLSLTFKVKQSA